MKIEKVTSMIVMSFVCIINIFGFDLQDQENNNKIHALRDQKKQEFIQKSSQKIVRAQWQSNDILVSTFDFNGDKGLLQLLAC